MLTNIRLLDEIYQKLVNHMYTYQKNYKKKHIYSTSNTYTIYPQYNTTDYKKTVLPLISRDQEWSTNIE